MHTSPRKLIPGLAGTLLLIMAAAASGQPLPSAVPNASWGPAGEVSAVARQGDTLYVGGSFRYVGPSTGPLAVFAIDGADPVVVAQDFDGSVQQLLPMPDGGWIVVGDLRPSPSTFRRVARIDPQGRFDPSWFVDVAGLVTALATDGSRVFLGGNFISVNGTARTSLAAVDAATGAVLPWNPLLEGTGPATVSSLVVQQTRLYLGGQFRSVNAVERIGFAALDTTTAALLPHAQTAFTAVNDLALSGDSLYLTGTLPNFSYSGIAVSAATGQLLPWVMPTSFTPSRIVATASRVFVAEFGLVRALDPVTGATIGPPLVSNGSISALEAGDGVLAVALTDFNDGISERVLTFDSATGQPRSWSQTTDRQVSAVAIHNGRLSMGGSFRSAGGVSRRSLFALDLRTGRPTAFAPNVDGEVYALAVIGNVVVAGGRFFQVNGANQQAIAALAADSAATIRWAPIEEGTVHALLYHADTLFVGGDFQVVHGVSRPNLAAIEIPSGSVGAWLPVPDNAVHALTAAGELLLAGGAFEAMAGGPRSGGASFLTSSGQLGVFDPRADGAIDGVAIAGGAVALVGTFGSLGGQSRRDFGIVDDTGAALPLALPFQTFGARAVTGMGTQFIVGGRFFGTETRALFAFSPQAGLLAWNPLVEDDGFPGEVTVLARYPDLLVAGGRFARVEGRRVLNLALFPTAGAGPPTSLRARVVGTTATLGWAPPAGTAPTSYLVEAGTATGSSNIGRFPVSSAGISGALAGGTYYVRIRAVVAGVEGQPSSEIVLTIPASPQPPSAPGGLAAVVGSGAVSLAWTAPAGNAESYVIEAGTSPGQANLATLDTGVLDTRFSAAVGPGTYYVRVRARNGFGIGPASNEVEVVVP